MIAPARSAAYRALRAIATGTRDLPSACAAEDGTLTDPRDRALMRQVVTGTERWRRRLDHLLGVVAGRDLARLDPEVLTLLELSAFQLLHLTRVPASAIVDDAVSLTRAVRKTSAAGFVNGVLRTLSRQRTHLPLPPRPAGDAPPEAFVAWLGITYAHPDWLVARWITRLGIGETEAWLRFNTATPTPMLRLNTLAGAPERTLAALTDAGVAVTPAQWAAGAYAVESGDPQPVVMTGQAALQDEASQLVAMLVDAHGGQRVLDACAAPGGKTAAIADRMHDDGLIVACDIRPRRMRILADTIRASGARSVRLVQVGGRDAMPVRPVFDWVLVDAPCSGLGTLRRDPDIKWRRREAELAGLAAVQLDILTRASAALGPHGRMIYATCSSEPEENDAVVASFLAAHPGFSRVDLREERPAGLPLALIDGDGFLRTSPHQHGLEAFFGAALRRV